MADNYVIDIIFDEEKQIYLNVAQSAIDNLRKKIAELQQMISGNIGMPIMSKAPEVVFYIKNAIGIPNRASQIDVTNGEEDESYYIRFIPINKQDVVIDLRTSDHIRGEEWSDRKDGGKHPNIRASAIVQDTESLTPTAETQKAHKVNGCRIKRITQKIPAKVYGTPEQAIKHLNTLICLFQNGKFGKYKENNKNKRLNCNRNMKQTIRLTESELRGMISEAVNEAVAYRTQRINEGKRNNAVKLTESQLREMINAAVNEALNELDARTYASYADKRQAQAQDYKAAQGRQAAVDAWNRDYGFNNGNANSQKQRWMDNDYNVNDVIDNRNSEFKKRMGNFKYNPHKGEHTNRYREYDENLNPYIDNTVTNQGHTTSGEGYKVADQMANGNGKYSNGKWQ